MQCSSGPEEY
uniref:Uncharacterized protein n=1 Tax=Oryza glumipatula TaxID=40148 RepID=A0A0G2KBN2_9ORYZ